MSTRKAPIVQQKPHVERSRKISQYSKDQVNTGQTAFITEKGAKPKAPTTEGSEAGEVRERRISRHTRDHGRARASSKREPDKISEATSYEPAHIHDVENTYKLEPDVVFRPLQVQDIIKDVLKENLTGQEYDRNVMASKCLVLSDVIKEKVCQLPLNRFKIIAMVLIGQDKEQSLQISSRCLWNHSFDNFASSTFSFGNLCAIGMVFAVYQE